MKYHYNDLGKHLKDKNPLKNTKRRLHNYGKGKIEISTVLNPNRQ